MSRRHVSLCFNPGFDNIQGIVSKTQRDLWYPRVPPWFFIRAGQVIMQTVRSEMAKGRMVTSSKHLKLISILPEVGGRWDLKRGEEDGQRIRRYRWCADTVVDTKTFEMIEWIRALVIISKRLKQSSGMLFDDSRIICRNKISFRYSDVHGTRKNPVPVALMSAILEDLRCPRVPHWFSIRIGQVIM